MFVGEVKRSLLPSLPAFHTPTCSNYPAKTIAPIDPKFCLWSSLIYVVLQWLGRLSKIAAILEQARFKSAQFPIEFNAFRFVCVVVVLLAPTACLCGATTTASGTEQCARTVMHNKGKSVISNQLARSRYNGTWRALWILGLLKGRFDCSNLNIMQNLILQLHLQLIWQSMHMSVFKITGQLPSSQSSLTSCQRFGVGSVRLGVG